MTKRRRFIGGLAASVAGLFGVKAAKVADQRMIPADEMARIWMDDYRRRAERETAEHTRLSQELFRLGELAYDPMASPDLRRQYWAAWAAIAWAMDLDCPYKPTDYVKDGYAERASRHPRLV